MNFRNHCKINQVQVAITNKTNVACLNFSYGHDNALKGTGWMFELGASQHQKVV